MGLAPPFWGGLQNWHIRGKFQGGIVFSVLLNVTSSQQSDADDGAGWR